MNQRVAQRSSPAVRARRRFLRDVLAGLRQSPKRLSCKYFYDERGSELFDQICELEDYYLTRTELAIMQQYAAQMGSAIGPGAQLVEFGSGSSLKTRYLLEHLDSPAAYVPVDISGEHLRKTARGLTRAYPQIDILPVCADFTADFALPSSRQTPLQTVVYFPGSTIGNFVPAEASQLLDRFVQLCDSRGALLIGIDLQKDVATIERAYDDAQGVTAQFNLNLLRRINVELGADFDLPRFEHRAKYNAELGRVEIELVSRAPQVVTVGGRAFEFARGEAIHTEYSHKYTIDQFARLAAESGWRFRRAWTDEQDYFAVLYLELAS